MATVVIPVMAFSPAQQAPGATVTAGTFPAGLYGTPAGALPDSVTITAGSTMTYSSSTGLGASWNVTTTSAVTDFLGWQNMLGSLAQHWVRMDMIMAANPSAQHQLYAACQSGSRCADISITPAGHLLARNAAGTTAWTSTNAVPLGSPFRVEAMITGDSAAGQVQVRLYPSRSATVPTEDSGVIGTLNTLGAPNQYRCGLATGGASGVSWDYGTFAVSPSGWVGPGAVVQQMACGAPLPTGFTVISKPVGGTSLRLKVATDAGLTQNVTWIAAQVPDAYGYVKHAVTGLSTFTRYYCQLYDTVDGAEVAVGLAGQCKTLPVPGQAASFKVAFASCINTANESPSPMAAVSDWIAWQPDLAIFTGDYHYQNPTGTTVISHLGLWEYATAWFGQEPMIRQNWGYYCRSNHDTYENVSQNTDDYQNPVIVANLVAAQEAFPQKTLGDTVNSPVHSLCQSWVTGRVLFIMLDDRNIDRSPDANTDNSSKTMLGSAQLAWLYTQLLRSEPLKVIITDTAWMGLLSGVTGDLEGGKWWSYSTERQAIINFMAANAGQVQNVMLWHGDTHALGCTPAANNPYGNFPVYCAAPMRMTGAAVFNGPTFTQLYSNSGGECRQYGRVTFTDTGSQITVQFSGWDALNQVQQIGQADTFFTPSAASSGGGPGKIVTLAGDPLGAPASSGPWERVLSGPCDEQGALAGGWPSPGPWRPA